MNKLESSLPRDALCQVWLKLVQCFCRRRFLNIFNIILHFYYIPLEKGVTFHLNKHKSPLINDALCQVLLKLAQYFWRRRFFCYFIIISPGKGRDSSLEQTIILFTQGCFVPSLVEIGPVVLEKKFF